MENQSSGLSYVEHFTESLSFIHIIDRVVYSGKTRFQQVDIVDTDLFGRILFLDSKIQSASVDEYIYHESLVHPPMLTHGHPEDILILGGGEGATLREALKYLSCKSATMVDIDGELVELAKKYLKEWHRGAFDDPRTTLIIDDARNFVFNTSKKFDVIISDLTEPIEGGPSAMLFTIEFYTQLKKILNPGGIVVIQAGTSAPVYTEFFASITRTLQEVFRFVSPYWAYVFSFQMPWAFVAASDELRPELLSSHEVSRRMESAGISGTRYYNPELHGAMFKLPTYLRDILQSRGKVLTDANPFTWEA